MGEGENVYGRLEEYTSRLYELLSKLHEPFDPQLVSSSALANDNPLLVDSTVTDNLALSLSHSKRKRSDNEMEEESPALDGREHIIAASALCQLFAPSASNTDGSSYTNLPQQPQMSLQSLQASPGATSSPFPPSFSAGAATRSPDYKQEGQQQSQLLQMQQQDAPNHLQSTGDSVSRGASFHGFTL
jgi:hypothetical protein